MERDFTDTKRIMQDIHFNSHAHVERDILELLEDDIKFDFNSHAHVERDISN